MGESEAVMLKMNSMYSGSIILNNVNDDKLNVNGTWVRIPVEKIKPNGVYSFIKTEKGVSLQHHRNSWSCDSKTMDHIQKRGNDILDRMFGDILNIK